MKNSVAAEPEWLLENINVRNKVELKFWCKMLKCDEHSIIWAIRNIGNSAKMVDTYLELNRLKEY